MVERTTGFLLADAPTAVGKRVDSLRLSEEVGSVWIVVPAYNEQSTIQQVVSGLRRSFPNIVVVDDCSSDLTATWARAAGADVLRHPINLGQGASLQTGIDFALQKGAGYIVTFDADLQHRPEDVPLLLTALRESGADFALGSRFLGTAVNIGLFRRLLLKVAVVFTRLTTGLKITDAHNGLRAMTRRGALALRIRQTGWRMPRRFSNRSQGAHYHMSRCP